MQILTGSSLRGNVSTGAVFVETGECKESGSSGQLLLRTGNVQHGYRAGVISLKGGVRGMTKKGELRAFSCSVLFWPLSRFIYKYGEEISNDTSYHSYFQIIRKKNVCVLPLGFFIPSH